MHRFMVKIKSADIFNRILQAWNRAKARKNSRKCRGKMRARVYLLRIKYRRRLTVVYSSLIHRWRAKPGEPMPRRAAKPSCRRGKPPSGANAPAARPTRFSILLPCSTPRRYSPAAYRPGGGFQHGESTPVAHPAAPRLAGNFPASSPADRPRGKACLASARGGLALPSSGASFFAIRPSGLDWTMMADGLVRIPVCGH